MLKLNIGIFILSIGILIYISFHHKEQTKTSQIHILKHKEKKVVEISLDQNLKNTKKETTSVFNIENQPKNEISIFVKPLEEIKEIPVEFSKPQVEEKNVEDILKICPTQFETASQVIDTLFPGLEKISAKLREEMEYKLPTSFISKRHMKSLTDEQYAFQKILLQEKRKEIEEIDSDETLEFEAKSKLIKDIQRRYLPLYINNLTKEQQMELAEIIHKKAIEVLDSLTPEERTKWGY